MIDKELYKIDINDQESDVTANNEKRKIKQSGSDNKKLKLFDQVYY